MSPERTSLCLLAGTGLLLSLATAPAHAAPPMCGAGAEPVTVTAHNEVYEEPLWSPVDQAVLEQLDRNGDRMLCVRVVYLPSDPPGLGIPEGETNVLVLTVDNPGGRR